MSEGPILKDATYYGFWACALLLFVLAHGLELYLLARILRELRG